MICKRKYVVIATALFVTAPLLYLALKPINLINVQVRPLHNNAVRILSADTVVRSDNTNVVFFEFRALVEDESIKEVKLSIRASGEPIYNEQQKPHVSNGFVLVTAQLGSTEYPIRQTEDYNYLLMKDDNNILSEGRINVQVEQIAGSETWLIAGIGIFASLLQILSTFINRTSASN